MEVKPDSAMAILDSFDQNELHGDTDRARYALLKSMALDKNWVDKTSFEVLQPAIDYYPKKGSPDEKLKTYYYQGRIFQNQGDVEKAFGAFARGLDIADECKDSLLIIRTLVAQGCIYHDLYDFENYTENFQIASIISNQISNKAYEFQCMLNILNGSTLTNNRKTADSINNLLLTFAPLNRRKQNLLDSYRLSYINNFGDDYQLKKFIDSIQNRVELDVNGMLNLSMAYAKLGYNEKAMDVLSSIDKLQIPYDTIKYLACSVSVYKNLHKYDEALKNYEDFCNLSSLRDLKKFKENGKILAEKHTLEINSIKIANQHSRATLLWILILSILLCGILILILLIRRSKVKKELLLERMKSAEATSENLIHRVTALEDERNRLMELLMETEDLPESVIQIVRHRINMLNSLLVSRITSVEILGKPFDEWQNSLNADKEKFLNENRIGFQVMYPKVISYLQSRNLSIQEINYLCLYAIGLNGTEIGEYLKMPSYRNKTKEIRKKLGLSVHDTNLGVYIRNLFKSQQSE